MWGFEGFDEKFFFCGGLTDAVHPATGGCSRSSVLSGGCIKMVRNIFRKCLVIRKISCNFASPLGKVCRRDNANSLRVRCVGA